jgi:hypothetical protein
MKVKSNVKAGDVGDDLVEARVVISRPTGTRNL